MNSKELILGALLLGAAYILFKGDPVQERVFTVPAGVSSRAPNGGIFKESQLANLGFVKYQGDWYHQTQFGPSNPAEDPRSPSWQEKLNAAIQGGYSIWNAVYGAGLMGNQPQNGTAGGTPGTGAGTVGVGAFCSDGANTPSFGGRGTCSHHGGMMRAGPRPVETYQPRQKAAKRLVGVGRARLLEDKPINLF